MRGSGGSSCCDFGQVADPSLGCLCNGGNMIKTIVRMSLILSLFAGGCGSSNDEPTTSAAKPKAVPAKPVPIKDMWRWPEGAGPQRDLAADHEACKDKARSDPAYKTTPAFGQFLLWGKCMGDLGWEFVKQPG